MPSSRMGQSNSGTASTYDNSTSSSMSLANTTNDTTRTSCDPPGDKAAESNFSLINPHYRSIDSSLETSGLSSPPVERMEQEEAAVQFRDQRVRGSTSAMQTVPFGASRSPDRTPTLVEGTTTKVPQEAIEIRFKNQVCGNSIVNRRDAPLPRSSGTSQTTKGHRATTTPPVQDGNLIVVNAVQVDLEESTYELPVDNNSTNKDDDQKSKRSSLLTEEKSFLVKMMVVALFLNTILAAGVVVTGFCLSGACGTDSFFGSSTSAAASSSTSTIPTSTMSPSMAPSTLVPTRAPTVTATPPPTFETATTESIPIMAASAGAAFAPPPVGSMTTTTASAGGAFGTTTFAPPPTAFVPDETLPAPPTSDPLGESEPLFPVSSPSSVVTTLSPTASPRTPMTTVASTSSRSPAIAILVPIVVVMEMIIFGAIYLYYRQWRQKRMVGTAVENDIESGDENNNQGPASTTSSCIELEKDRQR